MPRPGFLFGSSVCLAALAGGCAHKLPLLDPTRPAAALVRAAAPETTEVVVTPPGSPAPASSQVPIGIDTVLRLAEEGNGLIGVAREKVRESYAEQRLADLAWLPAFNVGVAYYRHEGGAQDEDGRLVRASSGALFAGMEILGRMDLREATFQKINAERKIWQQKGELSKITSETLLEASTTYIDLLTARTAQAAAQQLLKDEEEVLDQAKEIAKPNREPGTRFQVTAIESEVLGLRALVIRLKQQGDAASRKLAYLLGLGPHVDLVPIDGRLVAIDLVDAQQSGEELVARALAQGPGVRELERLLSVIHAGQEEARHKSLFPVVEMRVLEGGLGAGQGARLDWDNRWDFGIQARWNLTGLLSGSRLEEVAHARIRQAEMTYHDVRARLTLGVQEAREASLSGREEIRLAEESVKSAREGYQLSRDRLKNNVQGSSTTEVVQFIRGLQQAYLNYLSLVSGYDKAQLRLLVLTGMGSGSGSTSCATPHTVHP